MNKALKVPLIQNLKRFILCIPLLRLPTSRPMIAVGVNCGLGRYAGIMCRIDRTSYNGSRPVFSAGFMLTENLYQ